MTGGYTLDSRLLFAIASVWLFVASLYFVVPVLDMPPGQRVWTASGLLFALLALSVAVAERRAAT